MLSLDAGAYRRSMPEPPLLTLQRWEEHGAIWRTRSVQDGEVVVDLCACHGELVDQLRSRDPELLDYLARRPSSDSEPLTAPAPERDRPPA